MTKFEQLRTNAGLTITQLSIEANVSRATIEKIEKGLPVRASLAARACNALSRHLESPVTYQDLGIKTVK
jgi:DNA-binding XRE family transcriptional regulator